MLLHKNCDDELDRNNMKCECACFTENLSSDEYVIGGTGTSSRDCAAQWSQSFYELFFLYW